MNGQLPGNLATLANLGKVQILRLSWRCWRNKQQGQQQQRPGRGKNQSQQVDISITSPTISLVRVREQSKYNIPCFSSGMMLENCLQFQIVHIRFVEGT